VATVFKGSVNSTTNNDSYTTGTFATDASKVLVVIAICQDTTTNPLTISDTLGALTWTSQLQVAIGGGSSRAAIWTAPTGAGDPSGAVQVLCTGDDATGAFVTVWQVDADTSSPVTQLKNNSGAGGTTPTATFDANTQSDCIIVGMVSNGNSSGTGLTEPSGYTLDVGPAGHATPSSGFHGWHHDSPGAVGSVANGGSSGSGWDIFAVEVNPAAVAAITMSVGHILIGF
jgi:hypothetical protein